MHVVFKGDRGGTCLADYYQTHHEHGDEVFFSASSTAWKVQLISNKEILYLHLMRGYLKISGTNRGCVTL